MMNDFSKLDDSAEGRLAQISSEEVYDAEQQPPTTEDLSVISGEVD